MYVLITHPAPDLILTKSGSFFRGVQLMQATFLLNVAIASLIRLKAEAPVKMCYFSLKYIHNVQNKPLK